jgi:AraC family transcriptional regulator
MDEQKQLLTVDYKNDNDIRKILPAIPSHNSHQLGWNGVEVQYHEQPAGEMPENSTNQHLISVHLQNVLGTQERTLDGKKWVGPLENGQISLIPANSFHAANWTNLAKVNILILEPEYLVQLAHESVEVERVELRPILNIHDPIMGVDLPRHSQLICYVITARFHKSSESMRMDYRRSSYKWRLISSKVT